MNQSIGGEGGFRSLLLWSIIGIFCALPSFYCAYLIGFREHGQIAIMIAVVTTYVLAFSRMEGLLFESGRGRFARTVRTAAWIKVGIVWFWGPDMWLGVLSISAVQYATGNPNMVLDAIPNTVSMGMTAMITFVHGLNVSFLIYLIAGGLLIFKRLWPHGSPVQSARELQAVE